MSFLQNARDAAIHIQDSPLTAVSGDQNNHARGSIMVAGSQHIAGNQIIYQAARLKGALSR